MSDKSNLIRIAREQAASHQTEQRRKQRLSGAKQRVRELLDWNREPSSTLYEVIDVRTVAALETLLKDAE